MPGHPQVRPPYCIDHMPASRRPATAAGCVRIHSVWPRLRRTCHHPRAHPTTSLESYRGPQAQCGVHDGRWMARGREQGSPSQTDDRLNWSPRPSQDWMIVQRDNISRIGLLLEIGRSSGAREGAMKRGKGDIILATKNMYFLWKSLCDENVKRLSTLVLLSNSPESPVACGRK